MAALEAAMAAALIVMVGNLTVGKKRYAEVEEQVVALRDEAARLQSKAQGLSADDAAAYRLVHDAMQLPRDTDELRAERTHSVQDALAGAAIPPLQTMQVSLAIISLAGQMSGIGNRSAISDAGTAALSAQSAFYAARLNVLINLASVKDESVSRSIRERMEALGKPDEATKAVLERVEDVIEGSGS